MQHRGTAVPASVRPWLSADGGSVMRITDANLLGLYSARTDQPSCSIPHIRSGAIKSKRSQGLSRMILVVNHHLDPLRQTLFYNILDFLGPWCRAKPSMWLLSTNRSPAEITTFFHTEMGSDHLWVDLLHGEDIPELAPYAQAWVESRLPK